MTPTNNIIELKTYTSCICVGDIHGEFSTLKHNIEVMDLRDSVIICCGDIGCGFTKPSALVNEFDKLERRMSPLNNVIIFFRGNHDNPDYFNNTENVFPEIIDRFPHLYIASDYTIVSLEEKSILLIGGGISIDRKARVEGISYWVGENVIPPDEKKIDFIKEYNSNNIPISYVCSHSCPSFCPPFTKDAISSWFAMDKSLSKDLDTERGNLTLLYDELTKIGRIEKWVYGHFHKEYTLVTNDCLFKGIDMLRPGYSSKKSFYQMN